MNNEELLETLKDPLDEEIEQEVLVERVKSKYYLLSDVEIKKKIKYCKNPLEKLYWQRILSQRRGIN